MPEVCVVKDLGISYNNKLSFRPHIQGIVKNGHNLCYLFFRTFISRNIDCYVKAFNVYIRPILESSCIVFSPDEFIFERDLLESVQRRFTKRLFYRCKLSDSSDYPSRLLSLGLTSLSVRRDNIDLITVYKYLHNLFHCNSELFRLLPGNTRGHNQKIAPVIIPKSKSASNFFTCRIYNKWNKLNPEIIESSTVSWFKSSIVRV